MDISVQTTVPYPRDQVFDTMRDKLPELAAYLPNVDSITVQRRDEQGATIALDNLWKAARTEVPAVARPFVDKDKLTWLDKARWADGACDWVIEVGMFPDRVNCVGRTTFHDTGNGHTEVHIKGVLEISLKGMLPGLIARRAGPKIEAFVIKLIQPNFQKTAEAVRRYLDDNA